MDEQYRLALEYLDGEIAKAEARLYEHVSTTFRWIMATLFAANGGAVLALLGPGAALPQSYHAAGWFTAGVVFCLLMGVLSMLMAHLQVLAFTHARGSARNALITSNLELAQDAVSTLNKKAKMTWWKWSPSYAGLASLSCFVLGAITLAGVIS
jgi:hypothetical protein